MQRNHCRAGGARRFIRRFFRFVRIKHPRHHFRDLFDFRFADATKLPFEKASVDAVTISFGLRNVDDVPKALSEMYRVTKPGGKIVICEFSKVSSRWFAPFYDFYLNRLLPAFSALASKTPEAYRYLSDSINAWPNQAELAAKISNAGYKNVNFQNLTFGIVAVHRGVK